MLRKKMGFGRWQPFLLVLLLSFSAAAQSPVYYLHTHQSTYQPGETILGKWYVLQTPPKAPPAINLYADWYDDAGVLLQHQVWLIQQNTGLAQFKVPADYKGKFLRVVPYTLGAKNSNQVMPEQVVFIRPDALPPQAKTSAALNEKALLRLDTTGKVFRFFELSQLGKL